MTLDQLSPAEIKRTAEALARRDELHRAAIVDLLNKTHGVDHIIERLNYKKPKAVYELARRFELDVGVRFPWPWRKDQRPGPGLAPLDEPSAQN